MGYKSRDKLDVETERQHANTLNSPVPKRRPTVVDPTGPTEWTVPGDNGGRYAWGFDALEVEDSREYDDVTFDQARTAVRQYARRHGARLGVRVNESLKVEVKRLTPNTL